MPKSLLIDPAEMRRPGTLSAPEIPLNAYVSDPVVEAQKYGSANLVRIYRDMLVIREFETMLDKIKKEGAYEGVSYNHRGPAHLSIGQEAAAVGQAYHLTTDDVIFGSHRSHGEILAKSLSAIHTLEMTALTQVMETYSSGNILRVVEGYSDSTIKIWRLTMSYTARWPRFLQRPMALIVGWGAVCMPSSRHLG